MPPRFGIALSALMGAFAAPERFPRAQSAPIPLPKSGERITKTIHATVTRRCACGKIISGNKDSCFGCSQKTR